MAIGKPIRRDGHCADLSDQGDRDALENRNLLRGLAESMVVKFADYWEEETGQYPARLLFDWRATTYASLSQLTEAPGCAPGHSFRFVRCCKASPIPSVQVCPQWIKGNPPLPKSRPFR